MDIHVFFPDYYLFSDFNNLSYLLTERRIEDLFMQARSYSYFTIRIHACQTNLEENLGEGDFSTAVTKVNIHSKICIQFKRTEGLKFLV